MEVSSLVPCIIGVILLIGMVSLANAVRIVPEYQRLVVFRLGRPLGGAKGPGLVLLIPTIDRAVKVDLREQVREITRQKLNTRDNVEISLDILWYFKVIDPVESVLRVGNFEEAASRMAIEVLRAVIGGIPLNDILYQRDQIGESLRSRFNDVTRRWGVNVTNVEIRELVFPREVQEAINRQPANWLSGSTDDPVVVAKTGEAQTTIFTTGTVLIGNQTWDAMSSHPIAPKSRVRVKRVVLEVEEEPSASSVKH